jgi:hypothetical protein
MASSSSGQAAARAAVGMSMLNLTLMEWKKDVLESAADRFERRLTEVEGKLRVEMARMETRLVAWMFVFWLGQMGAMVVLLR